MANTETEKRNGRWNVGVVVALFVAAVLATIYLVRNPGWYPGGWKPPEQEPQLVETTVPLTAQTLVLFDDVSSTREQAAVLRDLMERLRALSTTERMCFGQILPDHPYWTTTHPCLEAVYNADWALPEFPDYDQGTEGYQWVEKQKERLAAEQRAKQTVLSKELPNRREAQVEDLQIIVEQLPVQPFNDPKGSLKRLVQHHAQEGVATTVVIYSSLMSVLRLDPHEEESPSYLNGLHVKVVFMEDLAAQSLTDTRAQWDPWFASGNPAGVEWLILPMPPREAITVDIAPTRRVRSPTEFMPPYKAPFKDGTNLVKGEAVRGDQTSIVVEH